MNAELKNYHDLYRFLCELRDELDAAGLKEAVTKIDWASAFYSGSSTEFMGEARIALLAIRDSTSHSLSHEQLSQIDKVIEQISAAFRAVGG